MENLQALRNRIFEHELLYACSFDPRLRFGVRQLMAGPTGVSLRTLVRSYRPGPHVDDPRTAGRFFHVLDSPSVVTADGRRNETLVGDIEIYEESLLFTKPQQGLIEGRMMVETDRRSVVDARFTGVLQCAPGSVKRLIGRAAGHVDPEGRRQEWRAFLSVSFETSDSRYRWLGDRVCVAFGVWSANFRGELWPGVGWSRSQFDVYAAT